MRRTHSVAALAVAGVLVTGSAAAALSDSSPASPRRAPTTVQMVLDEPFNGGTGRYVDLGKKGIGAGDLFLWVGVPLFRPGTDERIGFEDGTEVIASRRHDGTVEMNLTVRLHDGLVMLGGVVRHTDEPFRLAVLGGTGAYAGAGGQMTELREDRRRKVTVLQLDLIL